MVSELNLAELYEKDVVNLLENVVYLFDVDDDAAALCYRAAEEIVRLRRVAANARYLLTGVKSNV